MRRFAPTQCLWCHCALVLTLAVAGALGASPSQAQELEALVIKAGKVLTLAGDPLTPGQVLVQNGKITGVGATVEAPPGAKVLDLPSAVVMPGLVTAFTTLCETGRNPDESLTPELRLSDSVDYYQDWRELLAGGVTTAYLAPSWRRLMPGQGAVIKLGSGKPSTRLLRDSAGLHVVLGEWPKRPPDLWEPPLPPTGDNPTAAPVPQLPTTRAGELKALREAFTEAKTGHLTGLRGAALQGALKGEIPVRVRAGRAEDIHSALALADEFGLRLIIEGGSEAYTMAAELARRQVPVVLIPPVRPGSLMPDDLALTGVLGERQLDNAARLVAAGVKVAVAADDQFLPELLAIAGTLVGAGLPVNSALQAITTRAAEILGIQDRVGTLEVGKDADLLVLSGDPLANRSFVQMVLTDGHVVYERPAALSTVGATGQLRVFRAREVYTGTGDSIRDGEVRVRDGVIISVGPREEAPAGAEVVDLGNRVMMPGMIDMQSHLGLHWESDNVTLAPPAATIYSGRAAAKQVSIADAVDPTDPAFAAALQAGVTTIALTPAPSDLFCGSIALLKTAGWPFEQRLVKPVAALKFALTGDRDKASTIWQVRDLLDRARKYNNDWDEFTRRWTEFERKYRPQDDLEEPSRPARDSELEMLRPLLRGELPAFVVAERTDEISNALQVFSREFGLKTVLVGVSDGDRAVDDVAAVGAAVVGPDVLRTERGREYNPAAVLAAAGVAVTFGTRGTSGSAFLRQTAAYAVRHGLDARAALRGLTSTPARLLGLQRRLGSLEPGCDADLVVLSGDPLELTSVIEKVFVRGELAYDRSTSQ